MSDINNLLLSMHQEIKEKSLSENADYEDQLFFDHVTSLLIDCEEIEEALPCYYYNSSLGMKINGYYFNEALDCLDIFVVEYDGSKGIKNLSKRSMENCFKRASKFYLKSIEGFYNKIEEATEGFDLAQEMFLKKDDIAQVRVYLLTDMLSKEVFVLQKEIEKIRFDYKICDINRIHRLNTSGSERESIIIDFNNDYNISLKCLQMPNRNDIYCAYQTIFPASLLANIYDKYGSRLLEKNVRTFLQLRGKVNKKIRETINEEPEMFLAFNNGLTITVEDLELKNGEIISVKDFQIVNGGQTTASIYHTYKKDQAKLDNVYIQAKINHIIDKNITDDLTRKISLFANSQNKINAADFSSNDPYHVELEKFSRKIWAPPNTGSNINTRWFYERARGQYNDEQNRHRTPARIREWKKYNPPIQKFTKTDLAKYLNCWSQMPYIVSKGAQYNFKEFMIEINKFKKNPDEIEFKRIIAKAILFKKTDLIIKQQNYGDYKAQNVAYSLSFLYYLTGCRINLDEIWKNQEIPYFLENVIKEISAIFFQYLMKVASSGKNVTQFCKKKDCWLEFKKECTYEIPEDLKKSLISLSKTNYIEQEIPADEDLELIEWAVSFGDDFWMRLSKWGKITKCLMPWQNSIAYSIGKSINRKKSVSVKQANQAKIMYEIAEKYGFEGIHEVNDDIEEITVDIKRIKENLNSLPKVRIELLDSTGKIFHKSGLNWGQRPGRDPNQAYIPIRTNECPSDFFPLKDNEFDLYSDDLKIIRCVRAQANGKAIHSLNNAELGLYFRSRLSLKSGYMISENHLYDYGRTHLDIYKIKDDTYYLDFSV